jgi:putative endopeptidase
MFPRKSRVVSLLALVTAALVGLSAGQQILERAPSGRTAGAISEQVRSPKSLDVGSLDKSVDPCEDFYQYACGGWRRNNPIPRDQSRWNRFNELGEYNVFLVHAILEKAAVNDPKRDPITKEIGDFYSSCMDEQSANLKGISPIKPMLARIAAISTREQFIEAIGYLDAHGLETGPWGYQGSADGLLFDFEARPDLHDATQEIANVIQGGLGLPDRSYYINQDTKSQQIRTKYEEHLNRMFHLLGDDDPSAQKESQAVIKIETQLAEASFDRLKMRDPENRDHKVRLTELVTLLPNFQFQRYFQSTGSPSFTEINVIPYDFFQKVNFVLESISLDDWKSYLRWQISRSYSPYLSDAFVKENFDFFGLFLNGQQRLQPRWRRCIEWTNRLLGEALGRLYVEQNFSGENKRRTMTMVHALEEAVAADIREVPWMTAETKTQAELKLKAITNKIGYPDKWRDYSSIKIVRGDLLGNVQRAIAFDRAYNIAKIGKPLDKTEWTMTPPTVNAYYNFSENDINFPAGILQPPFFDASEDDAVNFGASGMVIGHELTHAFDDQGRKFNGEGNFRNWWTDADRHEFERRAECLADEYSTFVPVDDVHLNCRLSLGENTADNGGIRIALMAYRNASKDAQAPTEKKDGFTPEQRFFLSFAQIWCENRTESLERLLAITDTHTPGRFRVIGTLQNNADFAKAFGCQANKKMVRQNACSVW